MAEEPINFKVTVRTNATDSSPLIGIGIGLNQFFIQEVIGETTFDFDYTPTEDFELWISYDGNNLKDYILDDRNVPTNSTVLSIVGLEIAGIDCTRIAYNNSSLEIDQSEPHISEFVQTNCMDFSFRAVWRLPISHPVYIWILENL